MHKRVRICMPGHGIGQAARAVLYFAYGSNMASAQMPGVDFLGTARLDGYELALSRRSIRWQAGVLDILAAPGESVWGALYEVDEAELARIDTKEGAGFAYRRIEVELEDGRRAIAYEVIDKEPEPVPCAPGYRALVLDGARERGLPDHWLRELEQGLATSDAGTGGA
jgi:gamma-glutamylcyclotransferase